MFVAQLALAVIVWSGVVFGLFRRRDALFEASRRLSRGARARQAILRLFGSLLAIGLALALLSQGGLTPRGFTFAGWIETTALGAGFIALQTTALVPLVLNAVTREAPDSSDTVDADRP